MNTNEIKQILTQLARMGYNAGDFVELCRVNNWNTNAEKLNGVNRLFVSGWHKYDGLILANVAAIKTIEKANRENLQTCGVA